ncbi:MAG TPA: hypothetical protein VHB77_14125, partial [Planctomycetaceae bacterium]|nr:hypothetical protein [Planctomycetaceae bacterium]
MNPRPRNDKSVCRPFGRGSAALLLAATMFGSAVALQAADPMPRVRQVFVPITELNRELLGDRRPVRQSELRAWIAAERAPRRPQLQAVLDRAEYWATYGGSALREGRFTWDVQRTSNSSDWLQVQPLELVLKQLAWKDGPAVWGRAPDERTLLLVDRPHGEVAGEWELSGRELAQGTVFEFQAPQAAIARLHLRVPNAYEVKWAGSEVAASTAAGDEGWTNWTLDFGSRSNIRFAVTRKSNGPAAVPLMLVQQQLIYGIRSEGVRLQAEFNLDVLNAPMRQLEFGIDPDLQVLSASYGDVPLAWREETMPDRRIVINLPDALTGPSRGIRLRALTTLRTGQPWTLPGIRLRDGVLSDGQVSLQLQKPLELKQFETRGCRQTGIESAADEENITFRQFRPDASLRVTLGTTALKTSARVFTDLQTSSDGWTLASQIDWSASGGSAFSRQCRIPADWQITEVQLDGAANLADWNVSTDSRGVRLLTLQFLDALSPEHPKRVEIQARRLPAGSDHPIPIPMFEPLDIDELDALTAINSEATVRPLLEPRTTYDPVRIDDIPAAWVESTFWKSRWEFRRPSGLLLRLNQARPEGDFYLQSLQTPIEVRATVRADLARDRLGEAVALSIVPQHGRIERVLVYLSEAGPPPVWTFADGGSGPIEAKRLPSGRHAAWDLPPEGELWELRFSTAQSEPFALQGRRVRNVGAQGRVGLAFVPQATSFEGLVEFRLEEGQRAQLQPHNLTAIPHEETEAGDRNAGAWSYSSTTNALEFINARDPQAATPQVVSRLWLFSQLDWAEEGHDLHWAHYTLGETPGDADFQWELPPIAELLSIRLDGLPVSAVQEGRRWLLSGLGGSASHEIELHYQVPSRKRFAFVRREVPLPRVGLPVLRFDWDMSLPTSVRLGDVPAGMDMIAGRPQLSWAQRLCGPLGRIALPSGTAQSLGSEP